MDDDQNSINLLPDDLRSREDKIKGSGDSNIPVNFHIPAGEAPAVFKPPPASVPASSLPHKITVPGPLPANRRPIKSNNEESKLNVRPVKPKKGTGLLAKFFSRRKKTIEPPLASNQNMAVSAGLNAGGSLPLNRPVRSADKDFKPEVKAEESGSFNGGMDVNLIPSDTYLISSQKIIKSLLAPIIIGAVIGLLPYGGLIAYQQLLKRQGSQLQTELERGEANFNRYQTLETEAEQLVKKIDTAKAIIEHHVYWTKVLRILERLTIQDVYYKNLTANVNGTITISAAATSYTSVAKQYLVFQQAVNEIASVKITGAQGDAAEAEVSFNVILQLKPEVFYNLSKG